MERKSRTMIAAALSASFLLAGVALAAEKPPLKDAVKDPTAAAQKVIPKQVTKADSSAAATAAAYGIPMFASTYQPTRFTLTDHRTFPSGAAVPTYRKA